MILSRYKYEMAFVSIAITSSWILEDIMLFYWNWQGWYWDILRSIAWLVWLYSHATIASYLMAKKIKECTRDKIIGALKSKMANKDNNIDWDVI